MTRPSARGDHFTVGVWTGASTAPELDGALAAVDGIDLRMPYQSDPISRAKINAGLMDYLDMHLSHVAQMVWEGFFGHLDVALVEVAGITADGELIPSSSVGNNKTWIDLADRVILEVNSWQPTELEGMHDIYYGTALPPNRKPIPILRPADRIGVPVSALPAGEDRRRRRRPTARPQPPFKPPDADSQLIAEHVVDFLTHEVKHGPPAGDAAAAPVRRRQHRQRGAGRAGRRTVPAADGLHRGDPGRHAALLRSGTLRVASATAFSLSEDGIAEFARQHRRLPRPDRPAPAGDQQPSRGDPPARAAWR